MAIGNMSGFRLPGMLDDINIEEIVSRAPAAKKKAKLKELTGRMRGWKEKRAKTKAKSRTKAKPVVKAKAKPKPPTKPRGRPGIMVGEDLANRPKKVTPKPTPRTKATKVTPRPSSVKVPTRPKISSEDLMANALKAKKKFTPFQNVDYTPEYTPEDLERWKKINQFPSFSTESAKKFVPISVDGPSREELLESMGPIGSPGWAGPILSPGTSDPRENQLRSGIFKDAIYPGDPGYEEALAESKLSDSGGGGLFGGGRRLTPEIIQMIKEAQEARRATGGGGLFGLIGGGQRPQAPEIPQWNMMGPQQPINPIVGFQDESQPKYPDIPQFMQKAAGETFGGYGGLSSIKPIMQYAGMGDSPVAPKMPRPQPRPRPHYDPDAQPGGPPPPKFIHINRADPPMSHAEIASKLFRGV